MSRFPFNRTRGAFAMAALLALALAGCASQGPRADAPAQETGTLVAPASVSDATTADTTTPATSVDAPTTDTATAPTPPDAANTTATADTANAIAASPTDARTQAEQDYDAIYGSSPYDPVADPTLPAPAEMPTSYDPWEPFNRRMHRFNNAVDRTVAKPLAKAYVAVVPRPVRLGVTNFFNNLGQPVSALNALLQGKPGQAGQSFGRFLVNTTIGIAGLFDPATRFRIPNRSEDFGQTLGIWGWKRSRYVELPLFGPRTVRDTFGLFGDAPLSPVLRKLDDDKLRYFLQGLQLVDTRVQLLPLDSLREGAPDEYALFRDGWTQRRNYQIFGDPKRPDDEALPDYLLEEEANPMVPVDAMPIVPGAPTP